MSIANTNRLAGPFAGNDITTDFSFEFKVFTADELSVLYAASGVAETTLVLNSDYTVSLNADQDSDPGGTITLSSPLSTGSTLAITSAVDILQPVVLTNLGGFYPSVINDALDRLTIISQQLQEQSDRSLKVTITSGIAPDDYLGECEAARDAAESAASTAASDVSVLLAGYVSDAQTAKSGAETAQGLAEAAQLAAEAAASDGSI